MADNIDTNGNIIVHQAADKIFTFSRIAGGEPIDLSTATMRFVVSVINEAGEIDELSITPSADPDNALGRKLIITAEHAQQIGRSSREYVLQIVEGGIRKILLTGKIKSEGFDIIEDDI